MRENGTDRDLALLMLGELNAIAEDISNIKDNWYAPYIITQPTDQTVAVNDTASFSIEAGNAAAYQWQYKGTTSGEWRNFTSASSKTANFSLLISNSTWYTTPIRCMVTGIDQSVIYSEEVDIIEPAPEPDPDPET